MKTTKFIAPTPTEFKKLCAIDGRSRNITRLCCRTCTQSHECRCIRCQVKYSRVTSSILSFVWGRSSFFLLLRLCCLLKCLQVRHNEWLDNLLVNKPSSHEPGMVQPQEKATLNHIIKWNPCNQKAHDILHNWKRCKDNPICEPLRIVLGIGRVNGLEGHIRGVSEGEDVRY